MVAIEDPNIQLFMPCERLIKRDIISKRKLFAHENNHNEAARLLLLITEAAEVPEIERLPILKDF